MSTGAITPDTINAMVSEQFPGSAVRCHALGPDVALARLTPDAAAIRPGGYISGPTQFALADSALWFATFVAIGRIEPMAVTAELSIRFVRPAIGAVLWARAGIDSATRRQAVGSVRIWVDDLEQRPSALAQGTYALPPPG